jgi:hypothetical protein
MAICPHSMNAWQFSNFSNKLLQAKGRWRVFREKPSKNGLIQEVIRGFFFRTLRNLPAENEIISMCKEDRMRIDHFIEDGKEIIGIFRDCLVPFLLMLKLTLRP